MEDEQNEDWVKIEEDMSVSKKILSAFGKFSRKISYKVADVDKQRKVKKSLNERSERLLTSYKDAVDELEGLPENAKKEIEQIVGEFKAASEKLKEDYRKKLMGTSTSDEMLRVRTALKEDVQKLRCYYIEDVSKVFRQVLSE
jgi:F0F1-type ATP synthase membrane subunit b/b'